MSTTIMSSVYGMEDEANRRDYGWKTIFYEPCREGLLGPKILGRLEERSLAKASQVSHGWKQLVNKTYDARYELRSKGKLPLFEAIIDAVGAEPDEVTRAWHTLNALMDSPDFKGQASDSVKQKLMKIKPRLLQPEALILKDEKDRFLQCLNPDRNHSALGAFVQIIKDLEDLRQEPQFKQLKPANTQVFFALKAHYKKYLESLLNPKTDRVTLMQPKVILSGEGLIGCTSGITHHGLQSYRISQEMALSLLSKDRYGLFLKSNASGSHAVKKQGKVHFKGNTTCTGLPVGMESASYWFAQVLFGQGMTPTALLTLNEVEIKTPSQGTQARSDYGSAQATGKTSTEFFTLHPHHQGAFTEQTPHHVLQANLHVEGISLDDFMKRAETGKYAYKDLDLNSFSELIFISLLTNPSDAKADNFMVRMDQGKPYSIVGIDNHMAFGPPIVLAKMSKDKSSKQDILKPSLEVKNVLYCLPLMEQPLPSETRDKILNSSPELFLLRWLERLKIQQQLYDKLKDTGYTKENKAVLYLKDSVYTEGLQLPLKFLCGLVTTLLGDFTKLQAKIKSRPAITHNQLLSFFQPLVHRFYTALQSKYPNPLSAYQHIHNSNYEKISLEDILKPYQEETIASGKTIGQALNEVLAQDQTKKQSFDKSAQEIWKDLDLNKQTRIAPFLELAATTFPSCFQDKASFHASWLHNSLLFRALKEGASSNAIAFLLKTLKLDASLRDYQTQQNVLHWAIDRKYSPSVLTLLLNSLPPEECMNLVNGLDHKDLSPLDYGMEQNEIPSFLVLTAHGATTCSASIALKFYKRKVRNNARLHVAFRRLMALNPEVEWVVSLEELLPPLVSRKGYKGLTLTSSTYGELQLPEAINNQIIDKKGQFITVSNIGNHPVAYAQKKGPLKAHGLYFKLYSALPGLEEAAGRLTRQLLGFGAPYVDFVKLGEGQNAVPCLISQEIPGDTLLKVLKSNPQLLKDLDEEDISGMLIAAMLTNPEDGKPDNYIVTPHPTKQNKYRIIGIGNDQAFVPAIVKDTPDKTRFKRKIIPIAQVKTILYCLDQMKDPIHPSIRTTLINTHPDRCLEEWLRGLKRVNNQHCGLFTSSEQAKAFKTHESFIGVPFQQNTIRHIYEKFVQLRDLITDNPNITHMDLLNKLEPRLAKRYQTALFKDISVSDRFKEVDRPFYEVKSDSQKGESHTTVTKSANILQSMGIPLKEDIFDAIRLGKGNGPIQALEELEIIKTEKNAETLKSLVARVGDINLLKTLALESSRVLFLKELERQKKTLNPQEQIAILDYLAQQKGIRELPLPNFCAMDDKIFQSIDVEHLRKVDLRNCSKITNKSLIHLSKKALALEELNLGSLTQFKTIRGSTSDAPLIFKELRFLNLNNCIKLAKLLLQAPKLHYLNIENCALLSDQMLDGVVEHSENLRKLVFEGCPLITEKELRVACPNFLPRYFGNVGKNGILKILGSTGSELKIEKFNTSPQGINAFARAFKDNSNLTSLTSLNLYYSEIGAEGAKGLASGNLTNLIELYVGGGNIRTEGAKALAGGNLTALTSLDLWKNNIGDEGVKALVRGNFTELRSLHLYWNDIGDSGAKALAGGNLTNLTELNLYCNHIGAAGAKALAGGKLLNLTKLNLRDSKIGDEGAMALAGSNLTNLTELNLHNNKIGAEGAKALAGGKLTSLTKLDLQENNIGAEGAKALAGCNLTNLTSLNLGFNDIKAKGAKALAGGNLTNLTELNLGFNDIKAKGAKALAGGYLPILTTLNLISNNIGAEGSKALAGGNLMSLTTLELSGNNIGDEGAKALAGGNLTNLTELILWLNNIGAEGAKALAGGYLPILTTLNLYWNNIGAEGAKALAGGNLTSLTKLDLKRNNIGDEGAKTLAEGDLVSLTSLNLEHNEIRAEGAMALAGGNLTSLISLNLYRNNIGNTEKESLKKRYPNAEIRF